MQTKRFRRRIAEDYSMLRVCSPTIEVHQQPREDNLLSILCFTECDWTENRRAHLHKASNEAKALKMANSSHIEWTDATWNPVTGCTKVSPGCKYCYAERLANRLRAMGQKHYH